MDSVFLTAGSKGVSRSKAACTSFALERHPYECKGQNPCSEASHAGNFDSIVVMFCVSVPVLLIETCVVSAEKCIEKLLSLKQVSYREAMSRFDEKQTTFLCRLSWRLCFEPVCTRSRNRWTVVRRKTERTARYERPQLIHFGKQGTGTIHKATAKQLRPETNDVATFAIKTLRK